LGFLATLCGVSRTTTYYWIRDIAATTEEPSIAEDMHEIDFDEMWYFIQSKKRSAGSSKPWSIAQGERLPGYAVVVMLQRSNACMTQ